MKNFKKKKLFILILSVFIFNVSGAKAYMLIGPNQPQYALNEAMVTNYGTPLSPNYKLIYCDTSSYKSLVSNGVAEWNKLGKVTFNNMGTLCDLVDAKVMDYSANDSNAGLTNIKGKTIKFNTSIMSRFTTDQKTHTILHEFGHALGLDHREDTYSVMQSGQWSYTKPQSVDKTLYNTIWSKRYPLDVKSNVDDSTIIVHGTDLFAKDDYSNLYNFADIVLTAEVVGVVANNIEGNAMPQSLYKIEVKKIYKGDCNSSTEIVYKNGGYDSENQKIIYQDNELLKINNEYLLFIAIQENETKLILTNGGAIEIFSANDANEILNGII